MIDMIPHIRMLLLKYDWYSLSKSDRYPHQLTSKILDIPYFVNDYSFKQLKLNPNAFSKQEEEIENKAFYQT